MAPFDCPGVKADGLSLKLENFLVLWIDEKTYKKRKQLCGSEEGNGFELSRKRELHKGNGLDSDAIKEAGTVTLHIFPKCSSMKNMGEHLDAWEELLDELENGIEVHAPGQLLVMLKKTLPDSVVDEIVDLPDVNTYDEIVKFLRRRTNYKQQHETCEYNKKQIMAKARMHVLAEESLAQMSSEQKGSGAKPRESTKDRTEAVESTNRGGLVEEIIAALNQRKEGSDRGRGRGSDKDGKDRSRNNSLRI